MSIQLCPHCETPFDTDTDVDHEEDCADRELIRRHLAESGELRDAEEVFKELGLDPTTRRPQ